MGNTRNKKNRKAKLMMAQGGRCVYCQSSMVLKFGDAKFMPPNLATFDHVVPLSKGGGGASANNLVLACRRCNSHKSSKPVEEFIPVAKKFRPPSL